MSTSWGARTWSRRRCAVTLVLALATLALWACGSAWAEPPGLPSLAIAIQKSERVTSGQLNVTFSASQGGQSVALIVDRYAFDRTHGWLSVTADYRGLVAVDPALAAGLKPADFVFHVIVDRRHHAIYLGWAAFLAPQVQRRLPAALRHREWIKFDAETLRNVPGLPKGLARALLGALTSGPTSPLLALQALSTSPSSTQGSVPIGTVSTTRFSTTADMSRAGALGKTVLSLAQAAGPQWQAVVWVDSQSMIRQVQFTSPPIANAANASLVLTCRTQSLGLPIKTNDPTPGQVIPITALPR